MQALPVIQCCSGLAEGTLGEEEAAELERLFRALGDRHRVKILNLLACSGENAVCVCELVPALGLAQPTVSYHLKQLTEVGLLERERRGTFAYYRLAPGSLERLRDLFAEVSMPAVAVI
jgi:ArsR family transcriptional regulator